MKGQNRPPPAYQEYASDTLANMDFRLLSLAERGLRTTMRHECWVNRYIPSNAQDLALVLNLNASEVERALTKRLLSFFEQEGGNLYCLDLENYRDALMKRRKSQSEGGRSGGKKTQKMIRESQLQKSNTGQANLQTTLQPKVKVLSRVEERREESPRESKVQDEITNWINDYSSSNEYLKQSKGN